MEMNDIKSKIKDWVNDIGPMNLTVGDCQMWAFDNEVVSGKEVEKGVFSLANDGFLVYVKGKFKNPVTGEPMQCFRKVN